MRLHAARLIGEMRKEQERQIKPELVLVPIAYSFLEIGITPLRSIYLAALQYFFISFSLMIIYLFVQVLLRQAVVVHAAEDTEQQHAYRPCTYVLCK